MSEPLATPAAPEAAGGAPLSVPSTPAASLNPSFSAPAPVSPPAGALSSPSTPLASQPPDIQAAVQRGLQSIQPSLPGTGAPPSPAQAGIPAPTPPVDPIVEFFNKQGVPINDPALIQEAFTGIVERARQAESYQQQLRQYQFQQAQQPPPPTQPTPPPQPEDPWAKAWVPDPDPQWEQLIQNGYVTKNERGMYVAAPEAQSLLNPAVLHAMNQWEAQFREASKGFLRGNPYRKTFETAKPQIEALVEQRLEAKLAEMQRQMQQEAERQAAVQAIARFEEAHRAQIYRLDPVTGREVYTPQGEFIVQQADFYRQNGVANPALCLEFAQRDLELAQARQAPPQQIAPQPVPPPAPAVPAPQPSFMQQALANPKVQQALHNPSHVPQPPVVATTKDPSWASGLDEMKAIGRQVLTQIPLS